jgi:hypothetical protein
VKRQRNDEEEEEKSFLLSFLPLMPMASSNASASRAEQSNCKYKRNALQTTL